MIDLDRDRVKNVLLGIQFACMLGFICLGTFALGWIKSAEAAVGGGGRSTSSGEVVLDPASVTVAPEPVPGWVGTALWATAIVLVAAAAVDLYLLYQENDDFRAALADAADQMGEHDGT